MYSCKTVFIFLLSFLLVCPIVQIFSEDNQDKIIEDEIGITMKLFEAGKIDTAIFKLQQISKRYPKNLEVLMKLCEMALFQKNWAYSLQVLENIARLKPHDIDVRKILIDIYKAYQMPIQEIKTAGDVIQIDPRNMEVLTRLANLYHEQAMVLEEEETRRSILRIEEHNYDNLDHLARLYENIGEAWEEIDIREIIKKHYPGDIRNKRRLVRLYGDDKSIYQKICILRELRSDPAGNSPELSKEYNRTIRQYKKMMSMADIVGNDTTTDVSVNADEWIISITESMYYHVYDMFTIADVQLQLSYESVFNIPKSVIDANYHIGISTAHLIFHTSTPDNDLDISLSSGVHNITLYDIGPGFVYSLHPEDFLSLWITEKYAVFPFLTTELSMAIIPQYLYLDSHFFSDLGQGIESYMSLLRMNDAGIGFHFILPNYFILSSVCEYHWMPEMYSRFRILAELDYKLYSSDVIYDLYGVKKGYVKERPATQIDCGYTFELTTNSESFPLNEAQPIIHNHTLLLSFNQKLSEFFSFMIEGTGAIDNTLKYDLGIKAGLQYHNTESMTFFTILLHYNYQDLLAQGVNSSSASVSRMGLDFQITFTAY